MPLLHALAFAILIVMENTELILIMSNALYFICIISHLFHMRRAQKSQMYYIKELRDMYHFVIDSIKFLNGLNEVAEEIGNRSTMVDEKTNNSKNPGDKSDESVQS